MTKDIISSEIRYLVETIKEQQELVLAHQETIPQIEMDILMSNIRKLYERFLELNKMNQSVPREKLAPPPVTVPSHTDELIAHIATAEKIIAGLPEIKEEAPVVDTAPVIFIEEQVIHNIAERVEAPEPVIEKTIEAVAEKVWEAVPEMTEVKIQTNAPEHMQSESLISNVETPVEVSQKEIKEEAVLPQASLARERTKEFTKPSNKAATMASLFDDTPTVATKFQGTKSHLDKISSQREDKSIGEKLQNDPVSDLKKSIGINEKFAFINELFDGDLNSYNEAIEMLNSSANHTSAVGILEQNLSVKYNWNGESDSFLRLRNLIDRRFGA
ncbi:MAG TPA: hypothetical protein PKD91_10145 [Bacteroidia bacterium]|nr:hypothetical protein [Bacteroidia bacterium]